MKFLCIFDTDGLGALTQEFVHRGGVKEFAHRGGVKASYGANPSPFLIGMTTPCRLSSLSTSRIASNS